MSKTPHRTHPGSVQFDALREMELLAFPPTTRLVLRKAVRLLLVCRTPRDRQIVGYHVLHSEPLPMVAYKLKMTLARVNELYNSLCARDRLAGEELQRQINMGRIVEDRQ